MSAKGAEWGDCGSVFGAPPLQRIILGVEPHGVTKMPRAGGPCRVSERFVQALLYFVGDALEEVVSGSIHVRRSPRPGKPRGQRFGFMANSTKERVIVSERCGEVVADGFDCAFYVAGARTEWHEAEYPRLHGAPAGQRPGGQLPDTMNFPV